NKKINVLLPTTACVIGGILWANNSYTMLAPIMALILLIGIVLLVPKIPKWYLKTVIILALGFFTGNMLYKQQVQKHAHFLNKINGKTFDIQAKVTELKKLAKKRCQFYVTLFWEKTGKYVSVYASKPHTLQIGDTVLIKNVKFKTPKNNGFVRYLIKQGIATTIFANKLDYEIVYRPTYWLSRWLHGKKEAMLNSLKAKMSPRLFAIFSSAFLGNKNIPKEENQNLRGKFREWGILHILARSGLHLVIFLILCEILLAFVPIYFYIKQIIIIVLSILYLLLSWPSVSFIRAFSVLILYKVCPFLKRKPDLVHIVTIICLTMLLYNPIQIFFLDFQLSFFLTLTLATCNKIKLQSRRKQA
ncbi:ComEC/Rec2 family competence protein, partial [Candidatus Dependentiae bacterium]